MSGKKWICQVNNKELTCIEVFGWDFQKEKQSGRHAHYTGTFQEPGNVWVLFPWQPLCRVCELAQHFLLFSYCNQELDCFVNMIVLPCSSFFLFFVLILCQGLNLTFFLNLSEVQILRSIVRTGAKWKGSFKGLNSRKWNVFVISNFQREPKVEFLNSNIIQILLYKKVVKL